MSSSAPAIELRGVAKQFDGKPAVRSLDLTVPRGATYGLLGPNGAGKTTSIRMMLRILRPDAGEVLLFGRPVDQAALERIGYMPEERGLYKRMSVRRVLGFLGELKGVPPARSRPRIDAWLERLGLLDRADARVQELSKGMQQKIQLIGTLLHEPELVILDELFSGLDPINQRAFRDVLTDLKRQGRTILFSTHLIENAERVCDNVCIIARGEKVADGSVAALKREQGGEYVAVTFDSWAPATGDLLRRSPAVAGVREHGADAEITLRPGADPQTLLEELVRAGVRLRRFERVEPSLEQIFIDRVGAAPADEQEEVAHA